MQHTCDQRDLPAGSFGVRGLGTTVWAVAIDRSTRTRSASSDHTSRHLRKDRTMNISLTRTEVTVARWFSVEDATEGDLITEHHRTRKFYPETVLVTYISDDGTWTWETVRVTGPLAVKAGRSSKVSCTSDYYGYDVSRGEVPQWLLNLAQTNAPVGEIQ